MYVKGTRSSETLLSELRKSKPLWFNKYVVTKLHEADYIYRS